MPPAPRRLAAKHLRPVVGRWANWGGRFSRQTLDSSTHCVAHVADLKQVPLFAETPHGRAGRIQRGPALSALRVPLTSSTADSSGLAFSG